MADTKFKFIPFITAKCPNCGKGNVFKDRLYSLNFIEVNKECAICNYKFIPEPGFYYGAMYFTYAINVAIIIISLLAFIFLSDSFNPFNYLVTTFTIIVVSTNIIVRLSRLLMLYLFGNPTK